MNYHQITREERYTISTLRKRGRPDDERQAAIEWLRGKLADGPQPTSEVQSAADHNGFSLRTLQRAFREIHGVAFRDDILNDWHWKLPAEECQKRACQN